jgi:hypothetical protein
MERTDFDYRLEQLLNKQQELLGEMNEQIAVGNGIVHRLPESSAHRCAYPESFAIRSELSNKSKSARTSRHQRRF